MVLCLFTLPLFAKNTILVIGDSLSAGYGINLDQGWVRLLQQRLDGENYPYQVVNDSISGDTTSNGLQRLPQSLAKNKPVVTFIELGGNDGLRGIPITTIKQNIQKMIELTLASGSKVIVLGIRLPPNYGEQYTEAFTKMFSELGQSNTIKIIPRFLAGVDENPELMQRDGIHPTAKAQPLLVANIWPTLSTILKAK